MAMGNSVQLLLKPNDHMPSIILQADNFLLEPLVLFLYFYRLLSANLLINIFNFFEFFCFMVICAINLYKSC